DLSDSARRASGGLPPDAGQLNVKDYGAIGDGRTDDTQAILHAIADSIAGADRDRMVYFPSGTYLVSDTLLKRDAAGRFANGLYLRGQGQYSNTLTHTH